MNRLAWLTDIHLNFLRPPGIEAFIEMLAETDADAFAISGDIGEADDVCGHLIAIAKAVWPRPVHFVLGNHDFYRGSIRAVRREVELLRLNLHYLTANGLYQLTDETCIVGHDGWGDGRLGNYHGSDVLLNDFGLIGEFADGGGFKQDPADRLAMLNTLGDEAAAHLQVVLPHALKGNRHVIVVTHVPPFKQATWHEGRTSGDNWLPFFSCKAVGDVLIEAMTVAPDRRMTVLCGHTHGGGEADILPNLKVLTGPATYGRPVVQRVIDLWGL